MRGRNAARFFVFANPLRSIAVIVGTIEEVRIIGMTKAPSPCLRIVVNDYWRSCRCGRRGRRCRLPLLGLPAFAPEGTLWPLAKNALPNEVRGAPPAGFTWQRPQARPVC